MGNRLRWILILISIVIGAALVCFWVSRSLQSIQTALQVEAFQDAMIIIAVIFLLLAILCVTRVIWPPPAPGAENPGEEALARWSAECSAVSARATAIAIFVAVVGGALAWSSLKLSLLPLEIRVPDKVSAEGTINLVLGDPLRSEVTVRLRAVGPGSQARVTQLSIYIETKEHSEVPLFDLPLEPPIGVRGEDQAVTLPREPLQSLLRNRLQGLGDNLAAITRIRVEPRYTDALGRPRTPEGFRYELEIRRK